MQKEMMELEILLGEIIKGYREKHNVVSIIDKLLKRRNTKRKL